MSWHLAIVADGEVQTSRMQSFEDVQKELDRWTVNPRVDMNDVRSITITNLGSE
jgi:hypothetical protein